MAQNYLHWLVAQCTSLLADTRAKCLKRVIFKTESPAHCKQKESEYLEVLSQMLQRTSILCKDRVFVLLHKSACGGWQPVLDGLRGKSLYRGVRKGLRPSLCNGSWLLPFISVTSHHSSSPTEVATVPLAIKIMLGHAMLVCDSSVGNKRSRSSRNDANNWVVNLEQRWQQPLLWFLQETESGLVYIFRCEPYWKISNKGTARNDISSTRAFYHLAHSLKTKMYAKLCKFFFFCKHISNAYNIEENGFCFNLQTRVKFIVSPLANENKNYFPIFVRGMFVRRGIPLSD